MRMIVVPALVVFLLHQLRPVELLSPTAICAIVRDQNDDLEEWIQHHRSIGIQSFYIYDNGSTPPASTVLLDLMSSGIVTYTVIPDGANGTNGQFNAYNDCLARYYKRHRFIGFLDVDEYVYIALQNVGVDRLLSHYRDFGGVSLNWKLFGSSGHDKRPAGGVLQNYCTCQPGFDTHTKVFVNTAKMASTRAQKPPCSYGGQHSAVLFNANPHNVCYAGDTLFSVSITFQKMRGPFHNLTVTAPLMFIKHYITRSRADFQVKLQRGRADLPLRHGHPLNDRDWAFFERIQRLCTSKRCGCSGKKNVLSADRMTSDTILRQTNIHTLARH